MSEETVQNEEQKPEKVTLVSDFQSFTIMREPVDEIQTVNGVQQFVKVDKPPFKFENGTLQVTQEEFEEIKETRAFKSKQCEVLPDKVAQAAESGDLDNVQVNDELKEENESLAAELERLRKENESIKAKMKAADDALEPDEEPQEDGPTVVDSVTNFNEATSYLKEEHGLEHKDVSSKDKVFEQAEKLGIEFPNFPKEEE